MGPEDKVDVPVLSEDDTIPGLDLEIFGADDKNKAKKVPYSKPIPRNFQAQWNETGGKKLPSMRFSSNFKYKRFIRADVNCLHF